MSKFVFKFHINHCRNFAHCFLTIKLESKQYIAFDRWFYDYKQLLKTPLSCTVCSKSPDKQMFVVLPSQLSRHIHLKKNNLDLEPISQNFEGCAVVRLS